MDKKTIKNIIAVVLIYGFFFSAFMNDTWGLIVSLISGILVMGLCIIVIGLIHYLFYKELVLSKKIFLKISAVAIMLGYPLVVIGGLIVFFGISFNGLYEVDEVRVIKVDTREIVIDYTEYNNDDYLEKTLKKPIYARPKVGNIIHVSYPVKKPEKMHYIISPKTGGTIAEIGIIIEVFSGLSASIYILLMKFIKMIRKRPKQKLSLISHKKR